MQCYEQAIVIDEKVGNIRGIARHIGNIGIVYMDLKEYEVALDTYHKAIELNNSIGNKSGAATSWGNAGGVYYYQKNFQKARLRCIVPLQDSYRADLLLPVLEENTKKNSIRHNTQRVLI